MDPGQSSIPLADFEALYRATIARVHGLARRLVGGVEADDAAQDVYLRAWHKRASFRGEATAATWLLQVARNELVNRARARLSRPRSEPSIEVADPRIEARERSSDLREDLEQALERLPLGARSAFVLHDVEGLRHGEIARRLGISPGTSKSQLHRARALLRKELFPWSETDE